MDDQANTTSLHTRIEKILNEVRPLLISHGGNVELVDVDEARGIVKVRLQGSCHGCPMSNLTMKFGIEHALRTYLPNVQNVIDVSEPIPEEEMDEFETIEEAE